MNACLESHPDYLVDELRWSAPRGVRLELPWHLDATAENASFSAAALGGGDGLEDGFAFVRDSRSTPVSANEPITLESRRDGRSVRATLVSDRDATLFAARAPGQPASELRRFFVMRAEGRDGAFRSVLSWSPDVWQARIVSDAVTIELRDGERHTHRRDATGWHVELLAGAARSSIDLAGWRPRADARQQPLPASRNPTVLRRSKLSNAWLSELAKRESSKLLVYELGEQHYRRSEDSWQAAGSPRATVALGADDRHLIVYAQVRAGEHRFVPAGAGNPFDNEQADTMGAGLQLYARSPEGSGGWMLVPNAESDHVRVRNINDWGTLLPPGALWREHEGGYEMRIELPLPRFESYGEYPLDVDLIVNETTLQRQRRRGQLVMSGARAEFVYLRGDRHDVARLIPLVIVP